MQEPATSEPRVNHRIRVPRVLVIDDDGNRLGEFMTVDAIQLAQDRGLDLVEVAPNGQPPVCRVTDYGQLKYEKKKKAAVARRNQVRVQTKEVKVRPKTDEHDMRVKIGHARRFLEEGNKVKVTVRFRGREHAHRNIGADQCLAIADACKELSAIETPPRMEGRQMFMILAPTRKPVPKRARPESDERADDRDDDDELDDDDFTDEEDFTDEVDEDDEDDETGEDEAPDRVDSAAEAEAPAETASDEVPTS